MTVITKLSDGRFGAHNSQHGPFNPAGTTKYVPLLAAGLRTLAMAKATVLDPADGNWSQAGGDVALSGASDVKCLYAFYDAANSRIGVGTAQANGDLRYHEFDIASDSWTVSDEVIRQPAPAPDQYIAAAGNPALWLAPQAGGAVMGYHNGSETGGTGPHGIYRMRRSGGSWGAFNKINNVGSEVTSLFGCHNNPSVSGYGNAIGQRGAADTRRFNYNASSTSRNQDTNHLIDTAKFLCGPGAIDFSSANDACYFPFVDNNNKLSIAYWDSDDNTSSITIGLVSDIGQQGDMAWNGNSSAPYPQAACVYDGSKVMAVYVADSDKGIHLNDDATGTGGSESQLVSGIACYRLSVGISADNGSLLLLYADSGTVPLFKRHALGANPTASVRPNFLWLQGRNRAVDPNPCPPLPPGNPELPAVIGRTLWESDWTRCIFTAVDVDLANDPDSRGAIGFSDPSDRICADPGRCRQPNRISGTFQTVEDTALGGNAVRIRATRAQYETPDSDGKHRNHSSVELSSEPEGWSRSGRGIPGQRSYRLVFLLKLADDFSKDNPQWCILTQFKGLPDGSEGTKNPWLALSAKNKTYQFQVRGRSDLEFAGNSYYYSSGPLDINPTVAGNWDLFDIRFRYDWTPVGTPSDGAGLGWFKVYHNNVLRIDVSGVQVGFNDADGGTCDFGIYHNFNATSNAEQLTAYQGPTRFEELSGS